MPDHSALERFGKPPAAMARAIGFLLAFNGQRAGAGFASALEPLGLRPPHAMVMTLIDANPGITQQQLVAESRIDPSSMVALIDDFEERGLAKRRPHPSDRRKHAIHLTAKGTRTLARVREAGRQAGDELLARLEPGERQELQRLLAKLSGLGE
jgi:DNA-binding MarR family transcriptional regulator